MSHRSSLDIADGGLSVTISFGVTLTTPDDSPEAVLRRADALLYQSKRAGGDLITTDLD